MSRHLAWFLAVAIVVWNSTADAQPLGTFRWQLQLYCNVVSVTVTQQGGFYLVDGFDDQCGAPQRAPLVGLATPNPDGTIGFGLHVVAVPGGRQVAIDARIALAGLSGPWSDSAGNAGTFAFTPGAGSGGAPRPLPAPLLASGGGLMATGTIGVGTIPASGPGVRTMWYPAKAAFRAGQMFKAFWDDVNVGVASVAFGTNTTASGPAGTALGSETKATGSVSLAAGFGTTSSAQASVAFGTGSQATANNALAQGQSSIASGIGSVALGASEASGAYAVSIGNASQAFGFASLAGAGGIARGDSSLAFGRAETTGAGAFEWGDVSTAAAVVAASNQRRVRAAGGATFYSDAGMTTGVVLAVNGTQWSSLSDVNSKHAFRDLDGEDVLARIARMPVREWSYIAQEASIRHIGPTAQDFRAAFGLGEDPLRIGTLDAAGVALAAVRALEARTRVMREENEALRANLGDLRRELDALSRR